MIVRILGDNQYDVGDGEVDGLNSLDNDLQRAVDAGDEVAFRTAMTALATKVRSVGTKLPDDALVPSDALLPPEDANLSEVAEMLQEEGLIPG
ncbi:MAG: PspA-associated protein PspAA [Streptosporangiales bacterium]